MHYFILLFELVAIAWIKHIAINGVIWLWGNISVPDKTCRRKPTNEILVNFIYEI